MATNTDRVLATLTRSLGGLDDDELARHAGISPRQQVNQICRALASSGRIKREIGPRGKIINKPMMSTPQDVCPGATSYEAKAPPVTKYPELSTETLSKSVHEDLSEDMVKGHLAKWLEAAGWNVTVAWGNAHGIDVVATKSGRRWVIEAKGSGSRPEMRVNYFLAILGTLLQRMDDNAARYSIALPDIPQFRRLWGRLPATAKARLAISALFVGSDGTVLVA